MPSSASSAQARAARMHVVVFMYLFGYLQESTVFPFWIFSFFTNFYYFSTSTAHEPGSLQMLVGLLHGVFCSIRCCSMPV